MIAKPDNGVVQLQPSNLKQKMISIISRLSGTMKQFISLKIVTSSEICTFDGLIDHDGNIVFSTTSIMPTSLDLMIYKMDNSLLRS